MNIPSTVKAKDTDYVILDCDYDLEDTPSNGLVVKWFFNANEVAYQWIYGRDPLAGDITRKYVDLKYKASDNPYTTYRAMKLNKPGIDLSGEYKCVISTFADEQSASASMLVYCKYFIINLWSFMRFISNIILWFRDFLLFYFFFIFFFFLSFSLNLINIFIIFLFNGIEYSYVIRTTFFISNRHFFRIERT